jgi:P27 family predicted phage terminase small subunit
MSAKGGRPPKPSALKPPGLAGVPTSISSETRPEDLLVPAGMPREAIALWKDLLPELVAANVFERVDRSALKAMCMQWARVEMARRVLATEGLFARGSMGQLVEHPALGIEAKSSALFLRFAEQFGMTASARARLDMDERMGRNPGVEMERKIGESPRLTAIRGGKES